MNIDLLNELISAQRHVRNCSALNSMKMLNAQHREPCSKNVYPVSHIKHTGILSMLLTSITFLVLGILSTQFSLLELTLDERARMRPDLPPYDMWVQPPPVVRMSMHIFAVANADAFLDGRDAKLHMQEIGPIVYREHLRHENVTRHAENSTLSYTAVRWLEFLADENEPGILNRTIMVPNFALLSAASLFSEASFLSKLAFKALKISTGDTAFINITVYDYLWNYRSKLVQRASQLVPFMVPVDNAGILAIVSLRLGYMSDIYYIILIFFTVDSTPCTKYALHFTHMF